MHKAQLHVISSTALWQKMKWFQHKDAKQALYHPYDSPRSLDWLDRSVGTYSMALNQNSFQAAVTKRPHTCEAGLWDSSCGRTLWFADACLHDLLYYQYINAKLEQNKRKKYQTLSCISIHEHVQYIPVLIFLADDHLLTTEMCL